MGTIFVIAEHRQGELRDITFEMLFKANTLCKDLSHKLTAVVLGGDEALADEIKKWADTILLFEHERLKNFDGDLYKEVISGLIEEYEPFITLMGHTSWGMDFAPALAIKTGYPLATDCVDIQVEDGRPSVIRQIYSGKIFTKVSFRESKSYLITVRPGSFTPEEIGEQEGEIIKKELPSDLPEPSKEFIGFEEAGAGELDITQADLLVSIGRGVGEAENIEVVRELADLMGGVLSCSRPIVDKNWLPKYHQVGTSGKSVKPKVYLAFGISGAFQHVAGISGAGTVIAVNKDPKAPIFRVADYGVVDDLFNVVDALKEKLK